MKLSNISEVNDLLVTIDKCKGDVFLKSQKGDVFNLKSQLSEYIAIGMLLKDHKNDLELFCDRKDDEELLLQFFKNNPHVL